MAPPRSDDPPRDVDASLRDSLARARRHAGNAAAEALEALRALLDAAALAATGVPADQHPLFAGSARRIHAWSRTLAEEGHLGDELGAALADALEAEIARWEERARDDGDARAVLRAFLGVREILWELGVRPAARDAREPSPAAAPRPAARTGRAGERAASERRPRARRVQVEG